MWSYEINIIKYKFWIHHSLLPSVSLHSSCNCCYSSPREDVPYVFRCMWHMHTAAAQLLPQTIYYHVTWLMRCIHQALSPYGLSAGMEGEWESVASSSHRRPMSTQRAAQLFSTLNYNLIKVELFSKGWSLQRVVCLGAAWKGIAGRWSTWIAPLLITFPQALLQRKMSPLPAQLS